MSQHFNLGWRSKNEFKRLWTCKLKTFSSLKELHWLSFSLQQQVNLNLATSHSCSVKEHIWNTDYRPVTSTEPTHDWEFKIEDPNRQDMRHYIDKIVINLHNTFPNPVRSKSIFWSKFDATALAGSTPPSGPSGFD